MLPVAILAGGLGSRLGRLTTSLPKCLLPVAGKPFLLHQIDLLRRNGITDIVLCVGHLGDRIQSLLKDGREFGVTVRYSFDGPKLLGTGGAIKRALPLLREAFFVLYGDSYLDIEYVSVQSAFLASGRLALMTVLRNDGRWDQSNVLMADGRMVEYRKSPPHPGMKHIDYGLGAFRREAWQTVPDEVNVDLADVYRDLLSQGQLAAFEVDRRFYEIGSEYGLAETERFLQQSGVHH